MSATLEQQAQNKIIIQEFIKHPGMALLVDRVQKKMDASKNAWLQEIDPAKAELIRQNSRAYAALMGTLNEFLAHGTQAQNALAQRANTNATVEHDQVAKGQ